ncbi:SRPBCC domain-containing protein [Specibacter cremeus]|uniref:SRPBCC domain-containing protein n=1 Tax=Specibacter cremeus TaxID=1629051 RepID=UPI000F7B8CE9|nr:SRPBCC domain-containing protein [Specibacter cremeus]
MAKEFRIVAETEVDGTPEQVFDAVTRRNAGWLWPMEIEPRRGGTGPFGSTVTVWEPPHRFANHVDGEGGFFNDLDYQLDERAGGKTGVHYVHSGVFFEDWDRNYDGARQHTDFYQHTLGQYVKFFAGADAVFADVQGPDSSGAADAFEAVKRELGVASVGQSLHLAVAGVPAEEAIVDYLATSFLGLRTPTAMYRFFGRNAFGSVVGMTVHLFAPGADGEAAGAAWRAWLDGLYAT